MAPGGRVLASRLRPGAAIAVLAYIRAYLIGRGQIRAWQGHGRGDRTGLVCSDEISAALAAVSVFVETLTMMAAGSFLSAAILAIWYRDRGLPWYVSAGALGLMVVSGLPTLPPLFRLLVRLAGVGRSNPETQEKLRLLGYKTLLAGWGLMSVMWILWGLSYWATLRAMGVPATEPIRELPVYTLTVAATVAGFVALVMPAGPDS